MKLGRFTAQLLYQRLRKQSTKLEQITVQVGDVRHIVASIGQHFQRIGCSMVVTESQYVLDTLVPTPNVKTEHHPGLIWPTTFLVAASREELVDKYKIDRVKSSGKYFCQKSFKN